MTTKSDKADKAPEVLKELSETIDIMVAPRRSVSARRQGVQPMSAAAMSSTIKTIKRMFGHEPKRMLKPKHFKLKSAHDEATDVYLYSMPVDEAAALAQMAQVSPSLSVEVDSHLSYGSFDTSAVMNQLMRRHPFGGQVRQIEMRIRVIGEGDAPLEGCAVTVEGAGFPQEATTDKNGGVVVPLVEVAGSAMVRSVFVRPARGHWNRMLTNPAMDPGSVNVIRLKPIAETWPGFSADARHGWGQTLMGLDRLPDEYTGRGVKIAIVDSGADNTHPALKHIQQGRDLTNGGDAESWATDLIGHGSHCAGIITGNAPGTEAIRGFAPEAEIMIYKVFPGGQFSSLIEALADCIEQDVDVISMSLGSPDLSDAVEQQIEECVAHGIACVVAAGNSGGPVQYPARSPNVLAVAALGQISQVPSDSWEASLQTPSLSLPDGTFSPTFTCYGPEIDVVAPGVGIISTVPGGFEAQSGTSMAAPHVCGMAALMLAHHAQLRGMERDGNRVAQLFSLIRSACHALPLSSDRTGSGVPDLGRVMQQFISGTTQPQPAPQMNVASAMQPIIGMGLSGGMPASSFNTVQGFTNAMAARNFGAPQTIPGGIFLPQGIFFR